MKYVLKELRRHRIRTIFSILGYAAATVFILIILCISDANKKNSFGILQNTGTHFIVYIPTETSCCTSGAGKGSVIAEGVNTMMMNSDMIRTIKNVEGVRDAAPCLLYRMYNETFRADVSISGIDTSSIATKTNVCARANLVAGKFLSDKPGELVAEQSFASAHNLLLGDTLKVFGSNMILAGIVNSGIKPVKADFYAPIELVRSLLKDKLQCNAPYFDMNIILVEVVDSRRQDDVMTRIKNMMYKFAVSSYNCYEPAYKVMSIIDKSSLGLTLMILVFLIIFSGKTQLTSLIERFREIGILKSIGWSDSDLGKNILISCILQSMIGVTLGIIIGIFVVKLLPVLDTSLFRYIEFRLKYSDILLLYFLSVTGAIIASLFPVLKIYCSKAGDIIRNYHL